MNQKGFFITFEGADGSGKSTQIEKAFEFLKAQGLSVISTRDPGGTPLGLKIREILLNYEGKVAEYCELFLYLADRAQHIQEKILPELEKGTIVLCDRYLDSTVAYQGYARGLDISQILSLNGIVTDGLLPDLTFVFDVSTDVAQSRLGGKKDRLEAEGAIFHNKVREGYLKLAEKYPERICLVSSEQDIEAVFNEVKEILCRKLNIIPSCNQVIT